MSNLILRELERFAIALIAAQQTLLDLLRRKRAALAAAEIDVLAELEAPEATAARRLQDLVAWREKLLEAARRAGIRAESLTDLARSLAPQDAGVIDRLEQARSLAANLQRESWIQWVVTNRCCHFYGDVLELIAHGGRKPATYQGNDWVQRGGAVLNASA